MYADLLKCNQVLATIVGKMGENAKATSFLYESY